MAAAMQQAANNGDTEFLALHADKLTDDMPEAYLLFVTAYLRLDGEREYTRPIPWSKVVEYCVFYDFDDDQTEMAVEVLERVDNAVRVQRDKEVNKRNGNS